MNDKRVRLRVTLDYIRPTVSRVIDVDKTTSLGELHEVLQCAMGWTDSHLHAFRLLRSRDRQAAWEPAKQWVDLPGWEISGVDIEDYDEDERQMALAEFLRLGHGAFAYEYDFGDGWTHRVEDVTPDGGIGGTSGPAVVVSGKNRCPLEDVGGPPGWEEFAELYAMSSTSPSDPATTRAWFERREWVEAIGVAWPDADPRVFNIDLANRQLALLGKADRLVFPAGSMAAMAADGLTGLSRAALLATGATWLGGAVPSINLEAKRQLLRPVQWLLSQVGDGLKLTAAGWLPPAVVSQCVDEMGCRETIWGKGNRESETVPVAALRASMERLGLLRKSHGMLCRTKSAVAVGDDAQALWSLIVGRMSTRWKLPVQRLATALLLVRLTWEKECNSDEAAAYCQWWLMAHGYTSGGFGLDRRDAWGLVADTWRLFAALGGLVETGEQVGYRPVVASTEALRALAGEVLTAG